MSLAVCFSSWTTIGHRYWKEQRVKGLSQVDRNMSKSDCKEHLTPQFFQKQAL